MRYSRLGLAGVAALASGALIGGTTGTGEHVAFSPKTVTVSEGDGQAVVTVARDACENAAFMLDWDAPHTSTNADRGTAAAGSDYEDARSFDRWESCGPGGGTATQVFTVPILDDDEEEEDETINMSLGVERTSTNQTLLPEVDPDGTIVIQDDDRPRITAADARAGERDGVVRIPFELVNGPGEPTVVDVLTRSRTAKADEDFTPVDGDVAVAADGKGAVEVKVADDGKAEGDEQFEVDLSYDERASRTVTVTLSDPPPVTREDPPGPTQTTTTTATSAQTPPPAPAATPRAKAKTSKRTCISKRRFALDLTGLRSAKVRVGNRTMKVTRKRNGKLVATVDLRGNPKGQYTVKIAGRDARGRSVAKIRRYRTCAPRKGA